MVNDPGDDLENRLRMLERDVERLRREVAVAGVDASAARVLAGGADHEVSDMRAQLRAHTQVLTALRETQVEEFAWVREQFALVNRGFATIESKFAVVNAGIAHMTELLERPR